MLWDSFIINIDTSIYKIEREAYQNLYIKGRKNSTSRVDLKN